MTDRLEAKDKNLNSELLLLLRVMESAGRPAEAIFASAI